MSNSDTSAAQRSLVIDTAFGSHAGIDNKMNKEEFILWAQEQGMDEKDAERLFEAADDNSDDSVDLDEFNVAVSSMYEANYDGDIGDAAAVLYARDGADETDSADNTLTSDTAIQEQLDEGGEFKFMFNGEEYTVTKDSTTGKYVCYDSNGEVVDDDVQIGTDLTVPGFIEVGGLEGLGTDERLYIGADPEKEDQLAFYKASAEIDINDGLTKEEQKAKLSEEGERVTDASVISSEDEDGESTTEDTKKAIKDAAYKEGASVTVNGEEYTSNGNGTFNDENGVTHIMKEGENNTIVAVPLPEASTEDSKSDKTKWNGDTIQEALENGGEFKFMFNGEEYTVKKDSTTGKYVCYDSNGEVVDSDVRISGDSSAPGFIEINEDLPGLKEGNSLYIGANEDGAVAYYEAQTELDANDGFDDPQARLDEVTKGTSHPAHVISLTTGTGDDRKDIPMPESQAISTFENNIQHYDSNGDGLLSDDEIANAVANEGPVKDLLLSELISGWGQGQ